MKAKDNSCDIQIFIEIYPFLFNNQGTLFYLRKDSADIFPDDADEKQLNGGEEEKTDHEGCRPDLEAVPKDQFIDEVADRHQQTGEGDDEAYETGHAQRELGVIHEAEHGEVIERIEIVLRPTFLPPRLGEFDLGPFESDLGDQAPEIGIGVVELPDKVYDGPVIEAEAGEILDLFGLR